MKRSIIFFGIFSLFLFHSQQTNAQNVNLKRDTIYYLLDTANVPVKDRMFKFERESPFRIYALDCKCYPYAKSINFIYNVNDKIEEKISLEAFKQLNTVSITGLIDIALKCLPPGTWTKYLFIFIEPDGKNMQLTKMVLGSPYNPREVETKEKIEPE